MTDLFNASCYSNKVLLQSMKSEAQTYGNKQNGILALI